MLVQKEGEISVGKRFISRNLSDWKRPTGLSFSRSFLLKIWTRPDGRKEVGSRSKIDRFNVAEAPRCSLGEADGVEADGDEATGANCPFLH